MKTPQQAAAEIAAEEAATMYSYTKANKLGLEVQAQASVAFTAGFMKGVAWRPEVSEDVKERADRMARKYGNDIAEQLDYEDDERRSSAETYGRKDGYKAGYLAASADAAKREQGLTDQLATAQKRIEELEEQCAAKDRAIAELDDLIHGYKAMHQDHKDLVRQLDASINGDGAAPQASLCDIVSQVSDLFRKETGNSSGIANSSETGR